MLEGRIYNFSAGPSMLPEPVLLRVQKELLNCEGSGMSVMEMSHRSKVFDKIINDCQDNLRKLLGIPDNYKVLFLQGGASGIFAALPMNLAAKSKKADYLVSGNFSNQALKEAKALGMDVIVTDHHEVPFAEENGERREILPPALAVVDPKQEDCHYPFPNICGGVVAYKVVQALIEKKDQLTADAGASMQELLEELLETAALATVCDVMELVDENRIIVREGLKRMSHSRNQGLRALIEVNELNPEKLTAFHLGFVLGPCLNASGRLDTAERGLELLQCSSKAEAMMAANELKELNDSRKNMTLKGVEQAEQYINEHGIGEDDVMLIFLPEVHESLAGIIAGRIREKYNHPVFILTRGEEGVKGSGRSIEGYHMFEAMTAVKQYFTKFGGHKLAAGLSMREEDIEPLRKALNANSHLTEEDFAPAVHIDVPMPIDYATEDLARELERLEPFGVGNPKPLFAQKDLIFCSGYKMGKNKNFARFQVRTPQGSTHSLVFFGNLEAFGSFLEEKYGRDSEEALYAGKGDFKIAVTYQLGLNTYRGKTELQFIMQNYS